MLTGEDPSRNPVSNKPRNIAFELDIASHLARGGYKIDLKPTCDLWMTLPDFPVAVECKRPFTYRGLESAFKDGMTQLHRRYEDYSEPTSAKGMLALSLSKAENDGSLFLKARTCSELDDQTKSIMDRFVARFHPLWDNLSDRRTFGLLV